MTHPFPSPSPAVSFPSPLAKREGVKACAGLAARFHSGGVIGPRAVGGGGGTLSYHDAEAPASLVSITSSPSSRRRASSSSSFKSKPANASCRLGVSASSAGERLSFAGAVFTDVFGVVFLSRD